MVKADIKYYKALTESGGGISNNEVVSGVLNNLLKNITAPTAESGGTVYTKMFIKNTNVTDTAYAFDVCLGKYADGGDVFTIFKGVGTDTTTTYNSAKLYGIAKASAELNRTTKAVTITTQSGINATDMFAVGDKITFLDKTTNAKLVKVTIDTVSNTEIKITEDVPTSYVLLDAWIANTIEFGNLAHGAEKSIWLKQKVLPFTQAMETPPDSVFVSSIFYGDN